MRLPTKALISAMAALAIALQPCAAGEHEWEAWLNDLATTEEWTATDREQAYDLLCEMAGSPMNINTATREELGQLPFLTDAQVSDIQEYIYRHGAMKTPGELQLIESLDYARRRLLLCFVAIGEAAPAPRLSLAEELRRGRGEVTGAVRLPLYERRGDRNGYLGYKYKHWLRATFTGGDRLRLGFATSQDAGEPFFAGGNTLGYDFYSFFVELKRLGPVERLVLGRYTVSFGMGLVANTGFSLGKASALASLGRPPAGIRATASRSAASYLQGAAATVRLSRTLALSAFASYRPHDATLNKDDGTAATIVTSGYHRTPTEMGKKNNTHSFTAGINTGFTANGFHAGLTAAYTHYDRHLRPNTATLYRRHYASGNDFANFGADYGYTCHIFSLRGETALNRDGRVATINSISLNLPAGVSVVAVQRFYSFRYTAILANSFSEGGRVQNESGIYLGLSWQPTPRLRVAAYTDYAHFAWPRYRISLPSWASDNMLETTYSTEKLTLAARYRLRLKHHDNEQKTALDRLADHKLRLTLTLWPEGRWTARTQADFALAHRQANDCGVMVSQSVGARLGWLRLDAFVAYYHTDSYDSRLYSYERGPLYSFSSPAYYGCGVRYSLMARADIGKRLTLIAKAGATTHFDRNTIGSGYQQVNSPTMADIDLQARWKF